ncbi:MULTISPECIES: hypothetical protein [unclassified Pseudomonas]|uniref:hypothetical protein n=1 Tax=unclassified Pseudomonas TaxID=196821 RepID=UPI000CCFD478|nr:MULTISPECIES: hypothetical protein [unclassified Pseudomonas]POA34322.1 hypothetical protein C1887_03705 [Pseudomonas sp. GW456-R21]POA66431.1 hypothetical protein C1884_14755 [Pseudomonas sp. GW460-R15]
MGQITRTTNPTGLKQIDKKHFVVRVRNDVSDGRVFWLDSFDYEAAKLDPYVQLGCIVHAGSTEEYFDLGPLSDFKKTPTSIRAITTDKPLKFRFIFNRPGESLLVGYTDGVRALDEAGNLGSSLVDIEPTDLHGAAWKLVLPEGTGAGEKPNVLVERMLFPTAVSAANHPWFGALVMPEVMRQIAMAIAKDVSALDDSETWIAPWADFIAALGANLPIEFEDDDISAQQVWADEVVRKFAAKGIFKHHMAEALAEMEGKQI